MKHVFSPFKLSVRAMSKMAYTPSTTELYHNPKATQWVCTNAEFLKTRPLIQKFHQSFETYKPSRLIPLSNDHSVSLYVKEECLRLSLPSFKILGASWGLFRCLVERFDLPLETTTMSSLREYLQGHHSGITLVAATDGNHGRAVAHMAALLNIPSRIFTPRNVLDSECSKISSEKGAELTKVNGNYDETVAVAAALCNSDKTKYVLIQDFAFNDYVDVPEWIAHGYTTICEELPFHPDVIFIPAGAGCLAQGITLFYRALQTKTKVFVVEPDTSYTVNKSLHYGHPSSDPGDSNTIMDGLNCPTVSSIAFPVLQQGLSFSGLVSDVDCISAMGKLKASGVNSGPCGAVTYAAFENYAAKLKAMGELKEGDDVVLLSTEAFRAFKK